MLSRIAGIEQVSMVSKRGIEAPAFSALPDAQLSEFDYFVVASETSEHRPDLLRLTRVVRSKLILVEKPIFERTEPIPEVSDNRVFVAYNLRLHPCLVKLRSLTRGTRLNMLQVQAGQYLPDWRPSRDYSDSYSASVERGGGVALDLSHEIDYAQWIAGPLATATGLADKFSDLRISSDDVAMLVGTTEHGTAVSISVDYLSRIPIRRLVAHSEEWTVFCDLVAGTFEKADSLANRMEFSLKPADPNETYRNLHLAILERQHDELCTYESALHTLRVIEAIKKGHAQDVR